LEPLDPAGSSNPIHSPIDLDPGKVDQDFRIRDRAEQIGVQDLFQIPSSLHHLESMEVTLAMQIE
jgi:hypothetical protein